MPTTISRYESYQHSRRFHCSQNEAVLRILRRRKRPITSRELVIRTGMDTSAVARVLNFLETTDQIVRHPPIKCPFSGAPSAPVTLR